MSEVSRDPAIPASKMLNTFIKDNIAPVLLAAGFKASGRIYRRSVGEALQVVDIQNWKYNDPKRARFTIELGVCFPTLLSEIAALEAFAFYQPNLGKPGITECAIRRRIGTFLDPPQDTWWTVSAVTGGFPAAEAVVQPLVESAFPWLQARSSLSELLAAGEDAHGLRSGVMDVAAMFALGQHSKAVDAASKLAKSRHPGQPDSEKKLLDELLSLKTLAKAAAGP